MLDGLPIGQISAGALVGIFFLLVFIGRIPTLRELRDSQARERRAMDLAEKWQQVATEHGMTLSRILDYAETTNHVLSEWQAAMRESIEKPT